MDLSSSLLRTLRLERASCARVELAGTWAVEVPPVSSTQLHILVSGQLWLEVGGAPRQHLRPGSLCFIPTSTGYRMGAGTGARVVTLEESLRQVEPSYARRLGRGEPRGVIICIECDLGPRVVDPFEGTLPSFTLGAPLPETTHALLDVLHRTLISTNGDCEVVATRIAEAIFLSALTVRLSRPERVGAGWVAGLADSKLGRALGAMMRAPEKNHSVESLAREARMSRSSFATNFTQVVGLSPMAWLTQWRVQTGARAMLGGHTIEQAAADMGFASSSAFSRAFRKSLGMPPGQWVRTNLGSR